MWEEYVIHRCHAQSVYDAALLEHNNSIRELLLTSIHPHKWWSTLKTSLFGVNSSLPLIRTNDGSVIYGPSKKAEVFFAVFQNKKVIRNSIFLQRVFPNLDLFILLLL